MDLYYQSTRDSSLRVTASQAVLQGLAPDGGLFVPGKIPELGVELPRLASMTYQETALAVMKQFLSCIFNIDVVIFGRKLCVQE